MQDQVREIRQDLPRHYYLELPKLADGPLAGYPRVYAFARELITHTAGRLDLQTLVDFATAYQRVAPLTIGEIWAIPIMLRLALVEELRRLAADVVAARRSRDRARKWGVQLNTSAREPDRIIGEMLRDEAAASGRLSAPFVVELLHWLRDQPSSAAPAWHALQRALEAQDDSAEEMLRVEHQREAAGQLAIANIITTMRLLSSIEWPIFFERVSLVEQILREDPAGAYARMDFPTRDRYRHSVEQLARGAKASEQDVARRAVELAADRAADVSGTGPRPSRRVLPDLARALPARSAKWVTRPTLRDRFARFFYGHPVIGYLGTIAGVTALARGQLRRLRAPPWRRHHRALDHGVRRAAAAQRTGHQPDQPGGHVAGEPAAAAEARHAGGHPGVGSHDGGGPGDHRFRGAPGVAARRPRSAVLRQPRCASAFRAALRLSPTPTEPTQPNDAALVEAARRRVDELNARHGPDRFLFFHRARQWNPREQRWMGAERKRGKLAEFNRLLRGATDTSFVVQHGDRRSCRPSATSSRSTPTRSCRWRPAAGWSARSRIR